MAVDDLKKIKDSLASIKDSQEETNDKLDRVEEKVDALSGDIEQLHMDTKGIRDEIGLWHSRDKREIDEIKKHLDLPVTRDIPEA